jgi:hypothetical protein
MGSLMHQPANRADAAENQDVTHTDQCKTDDSRLTSVISTLPAQAPLEVPRRGDATKTLRPMVGTQYLRADICPRAVLRAAHLTLCGCLACPRIG